jgi:hypothetical protein
MVLLTLIILVLLMSGLTDGVYIKDPTRRSNNQERPIMAFLDITLVNTEWDAVYPIAKVIMLPKEVSDHNALKVTFGDHMFRFEKWWLEVKGFEDIVKKTWSNRCPFSDPMEVWQFKIRSLRKMVKGWSRNIEAEMKKKSIMDELDQLDKVAEHHQLFDHDRNRRKHLCSEIEHIWKVEEIKAR